MQFRSWVETQPWGTLKRLERELGISWTTLATLMRNPAKRVTDKNAELLSKATGGLVTVEELRYVRGLRPKNLAKAKPRKPSKPRTQRTVARALARIQAKELKKTG